MARVSKSRNVCGYVKLNLRTQKLQAKYDAKLATLNPLYRAAEAARHEAVVYWKTKLTGGQQAEAARILKHLAEEGHPAAQEQVNGYASAVGMAAAAPLRVALEWHLQSNHFPPVPLVMVPVAEKAIKAARQNRGRLIRLPDGVTYRGEPRVSAAVVVEVLHLEAFVNLEEEPS